MTIPVRNVTIKGVFAENASTTIPQDPVAGTSYRDNTTTKSEMNAGFPFKTIVDSSKFNEALYEYSTITKMQEKYGFVPWSNLTDYETGSLCLATNGLLYQALQSSGPSSTAVNPVNDSSSAYWRNIIVGSTRDVGELVKACFPLSDASLHLLDGSIIQGSGIYTRFVAYMASLVSRYPNAFTTEALWQSSVSNYGVCGKFVYNNANNTIRLPKITGFVEGTTDPVALGELVGAGLPNITGTVSGDEFPTISNYSGAFYKAGEANDQATGDSHRSSILGFDASKSNSIYGKSNTVQPQSIKVLYYIVIANSIKTEIEVDIDEIATDLNGKVDKADLHTIYPVIETYHNGTSWYRIYSDGFCIQAGSETISATGEMTVGLYVDFDSTGYVAFKNYGASSTSSQAQDGEVSIYGKTTSSFKVYNNTSDSAQFDWIAMGYITGV